MSVNSSVNSSLHLPLADCRDDIFIFSSIFVAYFLLLLLLILVVHMGFQRWRKQRSVTAMTSHSDIFTFHMVALELIGVLSCPLACYGIYTNQTLIQEVGEQVSFSIWSGQTLFHLLTCAERYLAVVQPVTYLGLRQAGGVRIRNISIGCVWAICFASFGQYIISKFPWFTMILNLSLLVSSLFIVSFCSLSVLRVLIRPGPGEVGGDRVDQSKQRAFFTIMFIMGALMLRSLSALITGAVYISSVSVQCKSYLIVTAVWCLLPSSLVLPLLFLHRAGKLPGCQH